MGESLDAIRKQRRPKGTISPIDGFIFHRHNPLITAWWSAAFPGFGHILLDNYVIGFFLIGWEFFINTESHINLAIMYSFTGRFEEAVNTLDKRWVLLYAAIYFFGIWDSYRRSVTINKLSILADREGARIIPISIGRWVVNVLDRRYPRIALFWSLLMPGVGQLYCHRLPTGLIILLGWIVNNYYSHILEAIIFTMQGDFCQAVKVADPQWILFMPSLYGFAAYDALVNTVEYNKMFYYEQSDFLKENYQDAGFIMPV